MQILCVDDDPLILEITGDLLRTLGHDVLERSSAIAALAEIRRAGPGIDLLLTDILMPEMDGLMLACRARISLPGLSVVYMSGRPVQPPGDEPVLIKPCTLGTLSAALSAPDGPEPRGGQADFAWRRLH